MERIDREKLCALNTDMRDILADLAKMQRENPAKHVVGSLDFVPQVSYLYEDMYAVIGRERVFVFTEKTRRRAFRMDISSLLRSVDAISLTLGGYEVGFIVFHASGKEYGLCHAAYAVRDGKFYMQAWTDEYKAGYVVIDKDFAPEPRIIPYSVFSMIEYHLPPGDEHMEELAGWGAILKHDFHSEENVPKMRDLERISKRKDFAKMRSHDIIEDHLAFESILLDALKGFVFLRTSDVYTQVYVPDPTPTVLRKKKGFVPLNYIQVDTTWDMNIDVNTPFPVRGHFVHQPCKVDGEWARKLIYVDTYMKKGYHRKAKKRTVYGEEED